MKPKATFTKKDLVVVLVCFVFLIANIAAIGEGGRKRAKAAVCLSNLLKWGQIFQAYTADNDGYFSRRASGTPAGWGKTMWPAVYQPLYKDPIMLCCAAAENPGRTTGPFATWGGPTWTASKFGAWVPAAGLYGSYGMNKYIENPLDDYTNVFWRRAGVKGGAQAPVFFDCAYVIIWGNSKSDPPEYDGEAATGAFSDGMQNAVINRHNGFINVCFLDFSARKVGLKEIWTLKWSRTYNTCDIWTQCGGVQPTDWPEWMRDFKDY